MNYTPPFTVSSKAVNLVAEISAQMERLVLGLDNADNIRLRRVNRMKTIHGSLAIEGNSLTEEQVTALIDGKHIVAPIKEIQEVRNAIRAYDELSQFNPYSLDDLLNAHGIMAVGLVDNAGHFRKSGVGVFGKQGVVHIAPPADKVPYLMADLFEWLKSSDDHILIKSSVFHYEFEFIHPFDDGNGRMGRFWQTRLLADWHAAFEFLPVENMIWQNQAAYYQAISQSTKENNSGIFVDFMLEVILESIKRRSGTVNDTVNGTVNAILLLIKEKSNISYDEIAQKLNLSRRTVSRKITELKNKGIIRRVGADKNGYWEIMSNE